jgi:3-oxoacyl-[acyl-carrier protein] reductase
MTASFDGNVALVTGAGAGIGFALCHALAQSGASVALNDLDPVLAKRAAERINADVRREAVTAAPFDVADVAALRVAMDEAALRFGRLDIAIANAGLTNYGSFLDYAPEAFDRLLAVNLRGGYFTAQAAARAMIRHGSLGRIVLMSSVTGVRAFLNLSAYGITKAGIQHMAQTLALELGPHGITVNAIAPGAVLTERTLADDPGFEANWAGVTPAQRAGYVEDVVAAAMFLASPGARHITGQTLVVDGGWSLASPLPDAHPRAPEAGSQLK